MIGFPGTGRPLDIGLGIAPGFPATAGLPASVGLTAGAAAAASAFDAGAGAGFTPPMFFNRPAGFSVETAGFAPAPGAAGLGGVAGLTAGFGAAGFTPDEDPFNFESASSLLGPSACLPGITAILAERLSACFPAVAFTDGFFTDAAGATFEPTFVAVGTGLEVGFFALGASFA